MIYQLIMLQLSAHLLADFILQPQLWSDQKCKKVLTAHHIWHVLVVFITSYLFSMDFGFWKAALVITVLHLGIDITKSYLQKKMFSADAIEIDNTTKIQKQGTSQTEGDSKHPFEKYLFFTDQAFHIIILILVSVAYSNWSEIKFGINIPLKNIAIISGFILCAKPANILIKNILSLYSIKIPKGYAENSSDKSIPNAGKLIGVLERYIAFVLILSCQFTAVGFIVTAKSILRFNASEKNEYVLVGTLLSFGIAVLSGILVNNL